MYNKRMINYEKKVIKKKGKEKIVNKGHVEVEVGKKVRGKKEGNK